MTVIGSDTAAIREDFNEEPAPLCMILDYQALEGTVRTLRQRIAGEASQAELATSTDFSLGE